MLEEQSEDFEGENFVGNLLVDEVGNEPRRVEARQLVVQAVPLAKLEHKAGEDQFPQRRQLRVHDSNKCSVHVGKRW